MTVWFDLTGDSGMPYPIKKDKRFRVVRAYARRAGGFYYKGQTRLGWLPLWVTRSEAVHSETAWALLHDFWGRHLDKRLARCERSYIEYLFGKNTDA